MPFILYTYIYYALVIYDILSFSTLKFVILGYLFYLLFNALLFVAITQSITLWYYHTWVKSTENSVSGLLGYGSVFSGFHNNIASFKFSYYTDWTYYGRYDLISQYTSNVDNHCDMLVSSYHFNLQRNLPVFKTKLWFEWLRVGIDQYALKLFRTTWSIYILDWSLS